MINKIWDEIGEINNVNGWRRFEVYHKADRNEFLSVYSGTLSDIVQCISTHKLLGTLHMLFQLLGVV